MLASKLMVTRKRDMEQKDLSSVFESPLKR
jgi:hypothetical protein